MTRYRVFVIDGGVTTEKLNRKSRDGLWGKREAEAKAALWGEAGFEAWAEVAC